MFKNLSIQGAHLISKPAVSDDRGSFHEVMNEDILDQTLLIYLLYPQNYLVNEINNCGKRSGNFLTSSITIKRFLPKILATYSSA